MKWMNLSGSAWLCSCLVLHVWPAWAAPVTFDQALQAALSSHPLLQGKRSEQAAARAEQEGAEWQRYPTPSIEANTATGGGKASVLRLDQPLWTGGRITAAIDAAGSRLDAAGTAIDVTRQDLALRVIAATGEALRQQERQLHARTSVAEHDKLLAMIRRRVQQEVSPLADQRLAESRRYAAVNEASFNTQALRNALSQLQQLMGPGGEKVTEVDPRAYTEAARPEGLPTDPTAAGELALAHSPILRRLDFESRAAQADIESKRSAYLPQLSLRLESSHGDTSDNRALLVLLAQPGAGLSAKSGVDAAVARREAARQTREAAQRDVLLQAGQDWNDWSESRLRAEHAELARATAAEVSESYARQYTAGRKSWLDVLNAVREATQAELTLVDTTSQMQAASLRLKVLTGVLRLEK